MNKEQVELLDELYQDLGIDISYDMKNNKPNDIDELMEMLDERINEIEVIYYNNAIDYLSEKDPSLQYSLEIASNYGFTLDKINSELLATLLKQDNAREEIGKYQDRLEELFFNQE